MTDKQEIDRAVVEIMHAAATYAARPDAMNRHALESLIRAELEARVPQGWMLVPLEPTDQMMDAAESCSDDWPRTTWAQAWGAMLLAAPTPQQEPK